MSPERSRRMSPGTSSRAGTTFHAESRSTRADTCNRLRSVSTTPAARCSCRKPSTALTINSAPTTTRSEYFPSASDSTMISSSIQAEMPQNFARNCSSGWVLVTATSLKPSALRRAVTSAPLSPASGSTPSAASASVTPTSARSLPCVAFSAKEASSGAGCDCLMCIVSVLCWSCRGIPLSHCSP
ncbi:hypothetical protein GALL_524280 [mine drainage metagenome]|uniref:Uncharacterized protein n=1 Tax=mine drainage metagenome TaxID=410659 RepID=A0A1J5P5K3_9ZZZZ